MVGSSKILTVSYGTFSCTLEGFDDPFSTMKSIAEYFRDLAADDRYFGAEPPTPDAEMLHRIAEREVQRRVEARVEDDGIVLRQTEGEAALAPEPAAVQPPAEPVASADPVAEVEVEDIDDTDGSVAAKLSRIRAVVAQNRAAPVDASVAEDDAFETPLQDSYFSGDISEAFQDVSPEDEIATIDDIEAELGAAAAEEPVADAPVAAAEDETAEEDAPATDDEGEAEEPEPLAAPDMADAFIADDAEDFEGEAFAEDADAEAFEGAALPEASEDDFEETLAAPVEEEEPGAIEDQEEIDSDEVAVAAALDAINAEDTPHGEEEPAPAAASGLTSRIVKLKRALMDAAPAGDGGPQAEAAETEEAETEEAETEGAQTESNGEGDESILAAIAEARDEAETFGDAAPDAETAFEAALEPEEPAEAVTELAASEEQDPLDDLDLELERIHAAEDLEPIATEEPFAPEALGEAAEADFTAEEAIGAEDAELAQDEAEDEALKPDDAGAAAFDRILEETNSKLADDEGSRRRSAIAHLKAAVAATKADRLVKTGKAREEEEEQEQSQYREDLAKVVRPRRPSEPRAGSEARARPTPLEERPAPLMLVSEQRVDGDVEEQAPRAAVQPRRVNTETLRMQAAAGEDLSFADFAKQMNATELPDLLEAAAAYSAFVEGQKHFSRPQLMRRIASYERDSYTREAGLRSFGQLLRQGKIQKLKRGQFTITPETRFNPEARIAGE